MKRGISTIIYAKDGDQHDGWLTVDLADHTSDGYSVVLNLEGGEEVAPWAGADITVPEAETLLDWLRDVIYTAKQEAKDDG